MKVLITAGGTTESIDSVRSITNTSTGKLGCEIAKEFQTRSDVSKIFYICGRNSLYPNLDKIEVIFIDNVASLEEEVLKICSNNTIDIVIHSMAVSDYRVKAVTTSSKIAETINKNQDRIRTQSVDNEFVSDLFLNSDTVLNGEGKIPSGMNDLILCMEQTPKIISLYQTIAPKATLVGFKLLDHVPHNLLIDTAYGILLTNNCDFVLANDLRDISTSQHIGYLLDENKNYITCTTKKEIAKAIVMSTKERRSRL